MRVSAIYLPHPHHSAHSGYPCFIDHLDDGVRARRPRPVHLPRRLLERRSGEIEYEWFGPDQLRLDLTAARRLVTGRREVVHLLYGETDHFYAGRLRALGRRRGNRLIATFHQPPSVIDELWPAPPLFEQIDHAIALGPRAADHLGSLIGERNVSCAFLGVDTDAWRPPAGPRDEVPTCAFVGSWFRDFTVLVEVVRQVRAAEPRVRFEIVTAPGRAGELSALPGVRARAGISDAELLSVYQRAWVHVLPLKDAVGNNALLEGMACGLPTVVSDVGDVAHYTGPDGARRVPRGDSAAMAREVVALLGDAEAREREGRSARRAAERRNLVAAARRHSEVYALAVQPL